MPTIDPTCIFHGKRASEHICLVCCFCYRELAPGECHELPDGSREDVCNKCAELEVRAGAASKGDGDD